MTIAALAGCGPSAEDIAACRKLFTAHYRVLSENGNPGRKEFTPNMTAHWDTLHAQFGRLGKSATAEDCEHTSTGPRRFEALRVEVKDLEAVTYKIADYDVAWMIRDVEADLARDDAMRRASSTNYVLIMLLRTLRERGADAEKALAPLVGRVDAAEPDSPEQAAAMVALYNVAASNAAFADFKEALESIRDFKLDEE
jgi:hypothetical protein